MAIHASAHAYGRAAQNALRDAIAQAKTVDGTYDALAPVTIVPPSPLSGYHIRRAFGRLPGGIVNVQFKPLHAMLELIGSGPLANAGRRPLGEAFRHEAIRAVAEEDDSVFGDLPIEEALLRTLEQRFAEFDECDDDTLLEIALGGAIPAYLVGRYREFRERTSNYYTNRDLAESATRALATRATRPSVLNDIGSVIVFLPDDWTPAQRRFLDALSRHTDVQVIVGLTGEDDPIDTRGRANWAVPERSPGASIPYAQRIVQSPDAEEEVRSTIRDIAGSLLSERPTPLHRTAILYRHAEPYARICAEQLDAARITWNGLNAQTLGQSIAGRVLGGILGLMQHRTPVWANDVAPWLAAAPIRGADGRPAPIARWNRLARSANLHRGPQDWTTRLNRYRATRVDDLDRLQRMADDEKPGRLPWIGGEIAQIDDLLQFVGQVAEFFDELPADASWSDYAERTRRQLRLLLGDRNAFAEAVHLGDDDQQLARWDDVQGVLDSFNSLDELGTTTPARFGSAAARGLGRQAGHHGRVGDGVYVGPLHTASGMEWDAVYIVGAAERALPPARSEDPLLSDALRARTSLPLSGDHLRRERSDFLVALHSAERRVLSYPRADVRAQQARLPSRWLLESATHLHDGERVYASKINEVGSDVIDATPSFEQAVTGASHHAELNEYDLAALSRSSRPTEHYLAQTEAPLSRGYEQRAQTASRTLTRWDGLIASGTQQAAAQPHSAGALQDWATCPYRYFLGRVLRVEEADKPRDDLQITPLDKGSMIHEILESFFNDTPSQPAPGSHWSTADHERLRTIAEERMEHAEEQGLTGRDLLWQRDRRRILDDLRTLLELDEVHRAEHQVRQIGSELSFGLLDGSAGLVDLTLQDGSVLQLRGMIDRVDRSDDEQLLMVIDYKTGGERPTQRQLHDDVVIGGRFLQLPIYAVAAQQLLDAEDGRDMRTAYWFITERGQFKFNEVHWDEQNRARFRHAVSLIVDNIRAGRFPANPGDEFRAARGEHCAYCSFDPICPADRRRHWERIRLDPQLAEYIELSEGEPAQETEQ